MTEPRRVIAGRRTADEWENSVGFFGIGKKKWEEQAKAAQAEAEAQADDVKSRPSLTPMQRHRIVPSRNV